MLKQIRTSTKELVNVESVADMPDGFPSPKASAAPDDFSVSADFSSEAHRRYRAAIEWAKVARALPCISVSEAARAGEAVLETYALYQQASQPSRKTSRAKDDFEEHKPAKN